MCCVLGQRTQKKIHLARNKSRARIACAAPFCRTQNTSKTPFAHSAPSIDRPGAWENSKARASHLADHPSRPPPFQARHDAGSARDPDLCSLLAVGRRLVARMGRSPCWPCLLCRTASAHPHRPAARNKRERGKRGIKGRATSATRYLTQCSSHTPPTAGGAAKCPADDGTVFAPHAARPGEKVGDVSDEHRATLGPIDVRCCLGCLSICCLSNTCVCLLSVHGIARALSII